MLWVKHMALHLQPPSKTWHPWRTLLFPQTQQVLRKSKRCQTGQTWPCCLWWGWVGSRNIFHWRRFFSQVENSDISLPEQVLCCVYKASVWFWLNNEHLKIFLLFTVWEVSPGTHKLILDRLSIRWCNIFFGDSCFINCSLETFYIMLYLLAWKEKLYLRSFPLWVFLAPTNKDSSF